VLSRTFKELRDGILSIAFPQECRICGRPVESFDDGVVCSKCWSDETLTYLLNDSAICLKCGLPLAGGLRKNLAQVSADYADFADYADHRDEERQRSRCVACATAAFTFARACGAYAGALEASLLFLKTRPHICSRLRRILHETILRHREALAADVVIPVPLHRLRRRKRGFNQATIIAESVARACHLPLDSRSLVRVKQTERHRAGMDAQDRRRSVAGAFEVVRPRLIDGMAVLLVDDLYTTGSTVSAAADVLVRAGAIRVGVLTISRVIDGTIRVPRSG
jgi:ComF family protein